jgi:hypothetical protein
MFGFFLKKSDRDRRKALRAFARVSADLRRKDKVTQIAVGHGIQQVQRRFIQRFGSLEEYRKASLPEKQKYAAQLIAVQNRFVNTQHDAEANGVMLFKSWLAAADDIELEPKFATELAFFSNRAASAGHSSDS